MVQLIYFADSLLRNRGHETMGGVFINYRAVDNPLGAAGIHDGLVRRFGQDRVFRDCVSLQAGKRYPAAIREALATAEIVVAVIGPQWLTLRDDQTGLRLIDRSRDWVRWELAQAIQRQIHVLPVLLADTPANATLPKPSELPDDIKALALIQAFEFSQRRFGEDLDRLVVTLIKLAPSLELSALHQPIRQRRDTNSITQRLPDNAFFTVVDALQAVPCVRDDNTRTLMVGRLRDDIAVAIRHYPERRAHIVEILDKCLKYDGGVTELLSLIRDLDQGATLAWHRLVATVDGLPPGAAS
jgi:Effector-associated domain 2/TIR domain